MENLEVLFDHGERNTVRHPVFDIYGPLGFPPPPPGRPWVFSNFVQSIDGIASLGGEHSSGGHISQSAEDRWVMDLLRAHADGLMMGVGTLVEERRRGRPGNRGVVFRIRDEQLRDLRQQLGRAREGNIFVTGSGSLNVSDYKVFDGDHVDAVIATTEQGAEKLLRSAVPPHVRIVCAGQSNSVDLSELLRILREELGMKYLLFEGGPRLNGAMARAGLIDERFLTVSPVEFGQAIPPGDEQPTPSPDALLRPTTFGGPGFTLESAVWWDWISCRKAGHHQFNRYRRRKDSGK